MRDYNILSETDRYQIEAGKRSGLSIRSIARLVCRQPSVISREIKKNGGYFWYLKTDAQSNSLRRRTRKGYLKIELNNDLRGYIIEKLNQRWAPDVIAGRWNKDVPHGKISKESIYQWIHSDSTKKLKLYKLLARAKKKCGHRKTNVIQADDAKISIGKRPQEINDRTSAGHLEGDLIFQRANGSQNILTIIDRKTRFGHLIKNNSKHAVVVNHGIKHVIGTNTLPVRSITFDNGTEFSQYKELKMDTYFCNPGSPWQKGSIEHFNGIIRRHIDFRIPIETITQGMLDQVAHNINNIPRKILDYLTPYEVMKNTYYQNLSCVASYS